MPFMAEPTLRLHYDKYYPTYLNKLNAILKVNPGLQSLPIEKMVAHMRLMPAPMRRTLRNCGGGHLNHSLFYSLLKPGGPHPIPPELEAVLNARFGSLMRFKEEFSAASAGRFGSGWCWLVYGPDELYLYSTANQDHPYMPHVEPGGYPLIGLDLWEHAYLFDFGIRRPAYVQAFWQVLNWEEVYCRYLEAQKLALTGGLIPPLTQDERACLRKQYAHQPEELEPEED